MFRKNIKIFILTICIFIGNFITSNAITIGQNADVNPGEGWNVYYTGNVKDTMLDITNKDKWDWGSIEPNFRGALDSEPNEEFRFSFVGDGFRIIFDSPHNNAEYIAIIDGNTVEEFRSNKDYIGQRPYLGYEKIGLGEGKHSVIIKFGKNIDGPHGVPGGSYRDTYYGIDSIHIKGELVPYSPFSGEINEEEDVILDIEPQREKIKIDEEVVANLTIDNIEKITAEDIRIKYDSSKLEFLGCEEVEGIKLIKDIENDDELRVILASKGESNIINSKEILLKLRFRGLTSGLALVDVTKGRVTDGIEMEKDLEESDCGKGIILIEEQEGFIDVNNSGEFTLLDLGIDARHLNKDPNSVELSEYNTDIIEDGSINDMDLLEIGKLMLENGNYTPNNY